ncbi:MAG: DNA gyrase inhibitor YacG [Planctomycetes bacterium]|nr:DNA gyrase inhibitor YacG [Planctomycetota bacterium]
MPQRPESDPAPPACPVCSEAAARQNRHFPFCSERCKLVDLGRWLGGRYRVESPIEAAERDVPPASPPDEEPSSEGTQ